MVKQSTDVPRPTGSEAARPAVRRKVVIALAGVLIVQALFELCLVSAFQILFPRDMPFGVVGSSPVVNQVMVQERGALHLFGYANQSAAVQAIDHGQIYGAYVAGSSSDTLIVATAKSFFARLDLQAAFAETAMKMHQPLDVQDAKPLPPYDPLGGTPGLLLIPTLIGGFLAAVLVFRAVGGPRAARWRALILAGSAVVGAVITDLIAGPLLGAYPDSHFWPLLPCLALVSAAVALVTAALHGLFGRLGTPLVAICFIVLGGASAGGLGVQMLPVYWQNIGAWFPPQAAVTIYRNVIYFGGNGLTTPLTVLILYVVAGLAILGYLEWGRKARAARAAVPAPAPGEAAAGRPAGNRGGARGARLVWAALVLCAFMEFLFALNYISSGHQPVATNLPFGTTASSPILTAAEKTASLQVTRYPSESAAKAAISQAKIYGALIPSSTAGTPNKLLVAPSLSDLAPLDPIAASFVPAAKSVGQPLKVQPYIPVPLAPKDPLAIVASVMMVPLFVGGYVAATVLKTATGAASRRWGVAVLAGYAIAAGLAIDLITGPWLQGIPTSSFWLVWPILSLTILAVALVAAALQRLLGAAGILLTIIVVILFGNPSSGGANGVPFLNGFWGPIGPYLPPRNAYLLLRNTIYFHGNGITLPLTVLLIYAVVAGLVIGFFNWFRSPQIPVTPETEVDTAAVATPVVVLP